MTDLDEALRSARVGDEEAFVALWRAFQPRLLRYLQVYAGGDVDDVASETWLHVVRDLPRFRGDVATFAVWLFKLARRRAIDAHRAQARRPLVLTDPADLVPTRGSEAPAAETLALDMVSTREALALIATLPTDQAEVVALRIVVGMDHEAIGHVLGISAGAARVRVHRGLRRLERVLAREAQEATA